MKLYQIPIWLSACCLIACTRETDEPSPAPTPAAEWSAIDHPLYGSTNTLNLAVWDDRLHILSSSSVGSSTSDGSFEQKIHGSTLPNFHTPFSRYFFFSQVNNSNQLYFEPSENPNVSSTDFQLDLDSLGSGIGMSLWTPTTVAANAQHAIIRLNENGYSNRKLLLLEPNITQSGSVWDITDVQTRIIDLPDLREIVSVSAMSDRFLVSYDTPDGRFRSALVFHDGSFELVLENEALLKALPIGNRWLAINRTLELINPGTPNTSCSNPPTMGAVGKNWALPPNLALRVFQIG